MAKLKNLGVHKGALVIDEKDVLPGQEIEVDGRKDWDGHIFVKAGWMEYTKDKPATKAKQDE